MEPDDYTIKITDINATAIDTSILGDVYDYSLYGKNKHEWATINVIITKGVLFEDYMPNPAELEKMCEEYPGLEKAYENFKTFYKLAEQDWRGKQKEHK